MDIVEFLRARLDEDEELARDAYYDGQKWVPEEEAVVAADRDLDPLLFLDRKCDAAHAANWSPARVLREVEAKRRIVDLGWHHLGDEDYGWGMEEAKRQVLAIMALPYADHPDYDPEWAI